MRIAPCLAVLLALWNPGAAQAQQPAMAPQQPAAARSTPVRIVGGPGGGCIAGAVELPPAGPGYQTIRASRSWYWGHPDTIAALQTLGMRAAAAGLPPIYMNDISRPRGGPMPGVHASHMLGLDADVWLDVQPKPLLSPAELDRIEVHSLVSADGRSVDPDSWSPSHATLIRLATGLPGIDRVLINPAIKAQLCRTVTGDRSWLHLVRPWYGHASHMHLHFHCPANQPECRDQAAPPAGDGCDGSLDWWFAQLDLAPRPPGPPPRPVVLPAACTAILAAQAPG